ncbi:siphovirus ReqiPepy6 Gp37-like family protein [Streptomyces sp. TBY4]|uniref:siphovirus ReqiPepy6 Gp37-like family protein n=1 Tax=Streptomyces sp. TBY4 TaxID=2962030 RepID=UPI0020B86CAB|nr:siphovirus ReqiPepy6 Gp37-like family protein [Streptomyces sp. TBY4]MCP3755752.1 siphovirus ReqiPepy6 Gp37-like family protein [Streptomyces sp. TBY4]
MEVRRADLTRVGLIRPEDLTLTLEIAHNNIGSWSLTLPTEHELADVLLTPGSGLIFTGPTDVLASGPMTAYEHAATPEDRRGSIAFSGVTDSLILSDMLAWPEPANPDVSKQKLGHDTRTGPAESLMHAYVAANIGPSAPPARRRPSLAMGIDLARGSTITKSARFPTLGELLSEIAAPAGLAFRIVQRGSQLVFETAATADRTREVRLDVAAGTLAGQRVAVTTPGATRVIVAGQGEQEARTLLPIEDATSIAAEAAWGRRIERFVDQRNTNDVAELTQAGKEVLAESGFTGTAVQAVPVEDSSMEMGIDWGLGDRVTVIAGGRELTAPVTGMIIKAGDSGFQAGALLGDPVPLDPNAAATRQAQTADSRISSLERTAEPVPPGPRELTPEAFTQATPPPDYPNGASVLYLTAADATSGAWDFGGKYGFLRTIRATNGDAAQTWSRVHAATTTHEEWHRGGNKSSGWSAWRQGAFDTILPPAGVTQAALPSTYPAGVSTLTMNSDQAAAGSWEFGAGGRFGVLRTIRPSGSTFASQQWLRLSPTTVEEWLRSGADSGGWTPWRKVTFEAASTPA